MSQLHHRSSQSEDITVAEEVGQIALREAIWLQYREERRADKEFERLKRRDDGDPDADAWSPSTSESNFEFLETRWQQAMANGNDVESLQSSMKTTTLAGTDEVRTTVKTSGVSSQAPTMATSSETQPPPISSEANITSSAVGSGVPTHSLR